MSVQTVEKAGARPAFRIGTFKIEPGTRKTVDLPVSVLSDHTPAALSVHVVHGRKTGSTLFVSAAIHGDRAVRCLVLEQEGEGVVSGGPEFSLRESVWEGAGELGGEDEDGRELDEVEDGKDKHEDLFNAGSVFGVADLEFTDDVHG